MNENKFLQVIYNYLTNDVSNEEIRELVIYLRHYIENDYTIDFETSSRDVKRLAAIMQLFNQWYFFVLNYYKRWYDMKKRKWKQWK
jgi:hypothetical protein